MTSSRPSLHGILRFTATPAFAHTVASDLYFTPPFKITSPHQRGIRSDFIVMQASAGMLEGDSQDISCTFETGSVTALKTQSYEKIFDTGEGCAHRTIALDVKPGARASFMPFPLIPFSNSSFVGSTEIDIAGTSHFAYSEIITCGRVAKNERFAMRYLKNSLQVRVDGKLAFTDRMVLDPSTIDYTALGLWQSYSHLGLLYLHPASSGETDRDARENEVLEWVRRRFAEVTGSPTPPSASSPLQLGASRTMNGICIRVLARSGQQIFDLLTALGDDFINQS